MVELTSDMILILVLFFGILVFFYLVVREFRLMRTGTRQMELEVEREKLDVIRQDMKPAEHPFARLSSDQLAPLQTLEAENSVLTNDIFSREQLVESRLARLEKKVKKEKLDRMIQKIDREEKRMG